MDEDQRKRLAELEKKYGFTASFLIFGLEEERELLGKQIKIWKSLNHD